MVYLRTRAVLGLVVKHALFNLTSQPLYLGREKSIAYVLKPALVVAADTHLFAGLLRRKQRGR